MNLFSNRRIHILEPDEALESDIEAWWQIYRQRHHVDRQTFMARFRAFDRIIFFREAGRIIGGSGFRMKDYCLSTWKTVNSIYIAQSYILPRYRNRQLLSMAYARVVVECKLCRPFQEIWFWMDAISYKPYLLLGNHVREFYPSPARQMPDWIRELRDDIGRTYYPGMYDARAGVVRKPARRLASATGRINAADLENEFIRYYTRLNPGHVRGEGLLCVFPGSWKNVVNFVKLLARKAMQHENHAVEAPGL